jgi:hypothetical protein
MLAAMIARLFVVALGVAVLIIAAVTFFAALLTVAAICGVLYGGRLLWLKGRSTAAARAHRRAELLARADIQHRWYLAGDPRGTYGRYPPAEVPLNRNRNKPRERPITVRGRLSSPGGRADVLHVGDFVVGPV